MIRSRVCSVAVLALLVGCSDPVATGLPRVDVELDVFSGLPNPTWTLSAAEAEELAERLSSLPPAEQAEAAAPDLGYRGFVLTSPEPLLLQSTRIRILDGHIFVPSAGDELLRVRDIHQAEQWLIGLAQERGHGEALQ